MLKQISQNDHDILKAIFRKTGGGAWEPPDLKHPFIARSIAAGYLRRLDGRCGLEAIKDSHVGFTDAGREAFATQS